MKAYKLINIIFLSIVFYACEEDNVCDYDNRILSFKVEVNNEVIDCTVKDENNTIIISGVNDGNKITDVVCEITDGSFMYPDPKIYIGSWDSIESTVVIHGSQKKIYSIILSDYGKIDNMPGWITGKSATIDVNDKFGSVTKHFFYDLKGWPNSITDYSKAIDLFVNDGIDGLRIPIYGNYYEKNYESGIIGHPEQGMIDEKGYKDLIQSIYYAKMAKPNLKIFASKKLLGDFTFPLWVKNEDNSINEDKYSELIIDFLKYMKDNSIEVDVIGIDNEKKMNEGNITVEKYNKIVNRLKYRIKEENLKMPKFIAHEDYCVYGYNQGTWLWELYNKGYNDNMDIYGTHYYPWDHKYNMNIKLKTEINKIKSEGLEFWATEPHWEGRNYGDDHLYIAKLSICTLWDQTDLGMDAFMWWNYKNSGSLRGCLMRAFSVPLHKSQPIGMIDHDGVELLGQANGPQSDNIFLERLHSRAFRNDNEVNVYVLNVNLKSEKSKGNSYKDYRFEIKNAIIDGNIKYTQWTDNSPIEGNKGIIEKNDNTVFSMDLPIRSITHFTFKIK